MTVYRFDDFVLDTARRELARTGVPVRLSRRAFDCLACLLAHRDRDVGRDELVAAVFRRPDISDAQLGQIVLRARRAVGDDGQAQRCIRTVPRYGFRWVGAVETPAGASPAAGAPSAAGAAAAEGTRPDSAAWDGDAAVAAAANGPCAGEAPDAVASAAAGPSGGQTRAAAGAERPGVRHPWGRLGAAAAIASMLAVAAVLAVWPRPHKAPATLPPPESISGAALVLPSRIDGPEDAQWARLGMMDYIADRLRRAGLTVPPSEATLQLSGRDGTDDGAGLRQPPGPGLLIHSRASHRDGRWRVELAATAGDGVTQRGRSEHADLIPAARAACDRLLAALGRTAPDAEGDAPPDLQERLLRAQAATLANQLDAARAILRAAPELQRQTPQLRYRMAQVDFHAGLYERSVAELDALLAEDDGDPLFRARLLNARGAGRIRLDRYGPAQRDFEQALGLLDPQLHPADTGKALNGRGTVRLVLGDFDGALADLGRSQILLARIGDAVGAARVDANLGHLEQRRDRPHQALAHFVRAAHEFESLGAINELMSMRAMVVDSHLRLLQNDEAARASERTLAMRPRLGDVAQRAMVDLGHARVLLRLGQLAEAARLLAAPARDSRPTDFLRDLAALSRVELSLQAGRSAAAVRLADAALAEWSPAAEPIRAWMLLRREQAALAAEVPGRAPAEAVAGVASLLPDQLIRALALRRAGEEAMAHQAYRQALVEADRTGAARDLVEVALDYVPWLIEQGRLDKASELAGRVAPWAPHDFDAALLQLRVHHAAGQPQAWREALHDVQRLAGEREVASFLLAPPAITPTQAIDRNAFSGDAMN